MLETARSLGGMVTSPHRLASEAGAEIIRAGGNAAEALVATLAALGVVYPHMSGLGGDGFWLLAPPGGAPSGIDASGRAGRRVRPALYREAGLDRVPARGGLAANTVSGAVGGYARALALAAGWPRPRGGGALPRETLLAPAIRHAEAGVPVSRLLAADVARNAEALRATPGFAGLFLPRGAPLATGEILAQPALARTLRRLASDGWQSFYDGELARLVASELAVAGSPLAADDLASNTTLDVTPLSIRLRQGRVFNLPPPTQGLASLLILGLFDRLAVAEPDGVAHLHGLVEATKQAFLVRDAIVGDPGAMQKSPGCFLTDVWLERTARAIDPARALPWPPHAGEAAGDTVWCGAVDPEGGMASAIGSLFHELGAGIVLPESGIVWQNRGAAFLLGDEDGPRVLAPGRKPFHTLNPAMAFLDDGRRIAYGTMGGEGQPQTQAMLFTRHAMFGMELQRAVTSPRLLLGRTWGEDANALRIEEGFPPDTLAALSARGHELRIVPPWSQAMGHAGAVALRADGVREGASDPRSDGAVACC